MHLNRYVKKLAWPDMLRRSINLGVFTVIKPVLTRLKNYLMFALSESTADPTNAAISIAPSIFFAEST